MLNLKPRLALYEGGVVVIFHKSLDVYRLSLDFVEIAADIAKHIPRGQSYLADQLRRSASSTVLNIGEGAGEFSKKEKARFYRMALRSATESASTIDIVYRFEHITDQLYHSAEHTLDRIIAMLTKLIHRHTREALTVVGGNAEPENGAREREPLR